LSAAKALIESLKGKTKTVAVASSAPLSSVSPTSSVPSTSLAKSVKTVSPTIVTKGPVTTSVTSVTGTTGSTSSEQPTVESQKVPLNLSQANSLILQGQEKLNQKMYKEAYTL